MESQSHVGAGWNAGPQDGRGCSISPASSLSLDGLIASSAHGFYFDSNPSRPVLYYKYSWVCDTPDPKQFATAQFNVDPLVEFAIRFG